MPEGENGKEQATEEENGEEKAPEEENREERRRKERWDLNGFAFVLQGSQWIFIRFAKDFDGFACILQGIIAQGIPADLHAFCNGSLWICMNCARDPYGFA